MRHDDYSGLTGQALAEAVRARKEMLNHLGQRTNPLSVGQMKRHRIRTGGHVWRALLRAEKAPKRTLYMPGKR